MKRILLILILMAAHGLFAQKYLSGSIHYTDGELIDRAFVKIWIDGQYAGESTSTSDGDFDFLLPKNVEAKVRARQVVTFEFEVRKNNRIIYPKKEQKILPEGFGQRIDIVINKGMQYLEGQVLDESLAYLKGISVRMNYGGNSQTTETDEFGSFSFELPERARQANLSFKDNDKLFKDTIVNSVALPHMQVLKVVMTQIPIDLVYFQELKEKVIVRGSPVFVEWKKVNPNFTESLMLELYKGNRIIDQIQLPENQEQYRWIIGKKPPGKHYSLKIRSWETKKVLAESVDFEIARARPGLWKAGIIGGPIAIIGGVIGYFIIQSQSDLPLPLVDPDDK